MLSDDVFRTQLAATFAVLQRTAADYGDVARIESAATPDFVRLSIIPQALGACAVEIMLRADQLYDIAIGPEFYEDCPIQRFDVFKPLIEAITRGDLVQRRHMSTATDTELAIETLVTLDTGEVWRKGYLHTGVTHSADDATTFADRRFVPYRLR